MAIEFVGGLFVRQIHQVELTSPPNPVDYNLDNNLGIAGSFTTRDGLYLIGGSSSKVHKFDGTKYVYFGEMSNVISGLPSNYGIVGGYRCGYSSEGVSSDGSRIIFRTSNGTTQALALVEYDNVNDTFTLLDITEDGFGYPVAISPDGTKAISVIYRSGGGSVPYVAATIRYFDLSGGNFDDYTDRDFIQNVNIDPANQAIVNGNLALWPDKTISGDPNERTIYFTDAPGGYHCVITVPETTSGSIIRSQGVNIPETIPSIASGSKMIRKDSLVVAARVSKDIDDELGIYYSRYQSGAVPSEGYQMLVSHGWEQKFGVYLESANIATVTNRSIDNRVIDLISDNLSMIFGRDDNDIWSIIYTGENAIFNTSNMYARAGYNIIIPEPTYRRRTCSNWWAPRFVQT